MTSKRMAMGILVGLIVMWGCNPPKEDKPAAAQPRPVTTTVVTSRTLPVVVEAVGRLMPNREVVLSAQVSGIVQDYTVAMGDTAAEDQMLVKLDPTDYRLALSEARANLRSARARFAAADNAFQRAKALLPDKVITQEVYEKIEAEFIASRAGVSQAETVVAIRRRNLEKTVIEAPFDGFVTHRMVELGQNVNIGDPVAAMADMGEMRVDIHMAEQDYVHLDANDPVTVLVEAYPETLFAGRVDRIGVKADPRTNTFDVEILVANPNAVLKAGLTAAVSIVVDEIRNAILIPQKSVLFREERKEVFVVDDAGKAAVREVTLGRVEGASVRILEGLAPGDRLVISGAPYLKDGDDVVIADHLEANETS